MKRVLEVEIIKLKMLKIWWLVIFGAAMPGIIAYLSFYNYENLLWKEYLHVAMLIFNVQSLLTFAAFTVYLWAREYEEKTLEIVMCYPYPNQFFLISKIIIMIGVIGITTLLFELGVIISWSIIFGELPNLSMVLSFSGILGLVVIMHSLMIPIYLLLGIVTKLSVAGTIFGIINMCICMMLYHTDFIQFIPPCIPFVLADHLIGMNVMTINSNYNIHWSILIGGFIIFLYICNLFYSNRLIQKS